MSFSRLQLQRPFEYYDCMLDVCVYCCCCVAQGDRNTWKFILHFDSKKKSKRGESYKNIQNEQSRATMSNDIK